MKKIKTINTNKLNLLMTELYLLSNKNLDFQVFSIVAMVEIKYLLDNEISKEEFICRVNNYIQSHLNSKDEDKALDSFMLLLEEVAKLLNKK